MHGIVSSCLNRCRLLRGPIVTGVRYYVNVSFSHAIQDVDVRWETATGGFLTSGTSVSDNETLSITATQNLTSSPLTCSGGKGRVDGRSGAYERCVCVCGKGWDVVLSGRVWILVRAG